MLSTGIRPTRISVSSPGKVLICGGYAVLLNRIAVVLSTSSRFHSFIEVLETTDTVDGDEKSLQKLEFSIDVISVQFQKKWQYKICFVYNKVKLKEKMDISFSFSQTTDRPVFETTPNIYISYALIYAFIGLTSDWANFCYNKIGYYKIRIEIKADNDFYSHSTRLRALGICPTQRALSDIPRFFPLENFCGCFTKTGLGSSAALISSLIGAIISWGFCWTEYTSDRLLFLHNISQVAHCQSQGKIGSGFDISSCIYGSQIYKMIKNEDLFNIINLFTAITLSNPLHFNITYSDSPQESAPDGELSSSWRTHLLSCIRNNWTNPCCRKIGLPVGLEILLGETGKDMDTCTSVKSVLGWIDNNHELSSELIQKLDSHNSTVAIIFEKLADFCSYDQDSYFCELEKLKHCKFREVELKSCKDNCEISKLDPSDFSKIKFVFANLCQTFSLIRALLKKLGGLTNTQIEPEEITEVLDETQKIPGVVAVGCPGAGGYDAIFTIVVKGVEKERIEEMWLNFDQLKLSMLNTKEDARGLSIDLFE